MFYVVGGEYTGTDFKTILIGKDEEYGPFETYEQAKIKWSERAWLTVDNCHYRFTIEER